MLHVLTQSGLQEKCREREVCCSRKNHLFGIKDQAWELVPPLTSWQCLENHKALSHSFHYLSFMDNVPPLQTARTFTEG